MTESTSKWQPLNDQILVRPLIAAAVSAGGIVLPEQGRGKPQSGVVMAIGPAIATKRNPGDVSVVDVGDLVAFGKYAGVIFTLDTGDDVMLMRETELLARKKAGEYELVNHEVPVGIAQVRTVSHEVNARCEHCAPEPKSPDADEQPQQPREEPSAFLREERERLLRKVD